MLRSRTSHSSEYQNSRARVSLLGKAIEWIYLLNAMLFRDAEGPSRVFARAVPTSPQSGDGYSARNAAHGSIRVARRAGRQAAFSRHLVGARAGAPRVDSRVPPSLKLRRTAVASAEAVSRTPGSSDRSVRLQPDPGDIMASSWKLASIAAILMIAASVSTRVQSPSRGQVRDKGLTQVPGIRVGHHTLTERPTGCTVVLVDGEGASEAPDRALLRGGRRTLDGAGAAGHQPGARRGADALLRLFVSRHPWIVGFHCAVPARPPWSGWTVAALIDRGFPGARTRPSPDRHHRTENRYGRSGGGTGDDRLLLPAGQDPTVPVQPTVRPFHYPPPGLLFHDFSRLRIYQRGTASARTNVRRVAKLLQQLVDLIIVVSLVQTHPLGRLCGWLRPLHSNLLDGLSGHREIIAMRASHREADGDAAAVGEHAALRAALAAIERGLDNRGHSISVCIVLDTRRRGEDRGHLAYAGCASTASSSPACFMLPTTTCDTIWARMASNPIAEDWFVRGSLATGAVT